MFNGFAKLQKVSLSVHHLFGALLANYVLCIAIGVSETRSLKSA